MREHDPSSFQPIPNEDRGLLARLMTRLFGTAEARWKARENRELAKASRAMDRAVDARMRADELSRH